MNILRKIKNIAKKRTAISIINACLKKEFKDENMASDPLVLSKELVDFVWLQRKGDLDGSTGQHPRSLTIAGLALATGIDPIKYGEYQAVIFSALSEFLYIVDTQIDPDTLTDLDKKIFKEVGAMFSKSIEEDKMKLAKEFKDILRKHLGTSFELYLEKLEGEGLLEC